MFHTTLLNVTDNLNSAKSFPFTLCFTEKKRANLILHLPVLHISDVSL